MGRRCFRYISYQARGSPGGGGGVSTDQYKVYQEWSIIRIAVVEGGYHIGEMCCAVPTCAND